MNLLRSVPVGPKVPLSIPREFKRLYDIAYNLWWSWDPIASDLWPRINPRAWAISPNPVGLLQLVDPGTWEALAANAGFSELYSEVVDRFDEYMGSAETWYQRNHGGELPGPVAYLCAEFGINQKLSFYSGGLGVLAGDHLKAASDLGIPLLGVGLLYRRGYFRQAVDPDGNQQHTYGRVELSRRPIRVVLDPHNGQPLRVHVLVQGRSVAVGAWRIDVGRVPLLLLDTDLPENDPADRPITHMLYVRGREMRLVQEIVLGVGGARVIEALDLEPSMWHVNEGHAALSLFERLSWETRDGIDMAEAAERVSNRTLFTLHTPVPAGNEVFDAGVAASYLAGTIEDIDETAQRSFASSGEHDDGRFDMGALAIRLSDRTNGVSKRHAEVVTRDWRWLIGDDALAITNGIHPGTWLGRSIERLLTRYVGEAGKTEGIDLTTAIHKIPAGDLWRAHESQKELMTRRLRNRLREEFARHGNSPARLRWIDDQLPADRLTIVFARRFATYKRAGLIFSDPGRITSILTNPDRPVQIVFAGKAHPADREGQALVKWVVEMSQSPGLEGHVFFIEDYDLGLAKTLVTGADVWLNTPRPPKEASGTSGMKAAINGSLNLSVLDGWWIEGYNGANGWGFGEHHASDEEDAGSLYHLLESEVVPLFSTRDEAGIPTGWVTMMKEAMISTLKGFSSHRMLIDYAEKAYLPLGTR
jgi:starch phosphorylase